MNHEDKLKAYEIFRSLTEHTPGVIFQLEFQKGKGLLPVYVCDRITELIGLTSAQIQEDSSKLKSFLDESEQKRIGRILNETIQRKQEFSFDIEMDTLHGKRWYQVQLLPVPEKGQTFYLNGIAVDITDQKRTQIELQETKTLLTETLDSIEEAVFVIGPGHRQIISTCNAAVERIFGYKSNDLAGRTTEILHVNPEMYKQFGEIGEPELEKTGKFQTEYRMRKKDGTIIDTYNTVSVLDINKGWQGGVVSTVRDTTAQKQLEKSLRWNEEKYRGLVEDINDIIFSTDENGYLTYISPVIERFGYTSEELKGKNFEDIIYHEDLEYVSSRFWMLMTGDTKSLEYRIISESGEPVWVKSSSKPIFENEKFKGFKGVVTDISREKELQSQLQHAQRMEAIGTLAGGVAHDFNNILSVILGFTELSLEEVQEETLLHKNLSEVLAAGNRATHLVKQILAISRKEEEEKMPVSVVPLIKEALKMLRSTIPSSIEFREKISTENLIVEADPTQLHQVIVNLATNAKQAMPDEEGLLDVDVSRVTIDSMSPMGYPDMPDGDYVRIAVSDTGGGIPEKYRNDIFEPYFTTKEKDVGTGLGLSVVHGIVKNHNGHVKVYSEEGKGTTFHVYLPLVDQKKQDSSVQPKESVPVGTETILLVDDEKPIVDMLQQILKGLGYQVTAKTSSVEALEAFQSQPDNFDMIITDMTMPKITGDELIEKIKKIRSEIPVILCTGFSEKLAQSGFGQNIDAFIMKPVDRKEMARIVRKVLDK
ncbi:MAG: PAS domain S-box protein, partial [Bacteroidales bacterium]